MNFPISGNFSLWRKMPPQLPKAMKLTAIFLLAFFLQLSAKSVSQVTLSLKNVSAEKVFREIERQTGVGFLYTRRMIANLPRVTIEVKNAPVSEVLDKCFSGQPLEYSFDKNTIVITRKKAVVPATIAANSMIVSPPPPPVEITGKVTDENGKPLVGVSVTLKGSNAIGTTTNENGEYSLTLQNRNGALVFSSVGYLPQEILINGRNTINVILMVSTSSLDQVIVVGYGTQKRSDLTGAISSVDAKSLEQTPIASVDQGLIGKAPGVMVTQTSGMPGAIASIRIRGTSSLQGGNEPLYVIDGVPVYNGTGFGTTGGNAQISILATLNPSDIESIQILKDASATAIYGSRAANGVVLITTKSGKSGSDLITIDSYYGTQSIVKKLKLMNGTDYARLVNEAYTNDGLTSPYSQDFISKIPNGGQGTDWQNEVYRSAPIQNYQVTFSGGDNKSNYGISLNYLDQDGIIINSGMKRYSGRLNFSRKMTDKFKIENHLSFTRMVSNVAQTDAGGQSGIPSGAITFNPALPVYSDSARTIFTPVNVPGVLNPNPVATALGMQQVNNTSRVLGDIAADWKLTDGLTARVLFGIDYFLNKGNVYIPSFLYESSGVARASISDQTYTNWVNENTLSYNAVFNKHSISAVGGITFQQNKDALLSGASRGFVNNILGYNSLGSGAIYDQPNSGATKWSLMSYLGRINYAFDNKYLVTVSGRYDGSSRFGEKNKHAFFPSVALAWKINQEDFFDNISQLSNLKLRMGYGVTGNQEIGVYSSLPTLGSVNYTFGSGLLTGFYPNKIPNPDLKWEKSAQYDVGLDMGFFNNRLNVTADYYYRKTTNLIYDVPITQVSGFATSLQNIGSIENKGVELSFESVNIRRKLEWTTSFNISFNRNKVLDLGGAPFKDVGADDGHLKTGQIHRLIVGKPISVFWGYVTDGIFQNQSEVDAGPKGFTNYPGGRRYKDISGPKGSPDGTIDPNNDRTIIGDPNPKFYGGLTNTLAFKGFQLNVFMLYSYGNDLFNYDLIELLLPSGGQNVLAALNNRWTPDNPSNIYPKATTNRSAVVSDAFIEDGSFLKFKTVTLSYQFQNLKMKNIKSLRLYVTGQNLLTFTKYTGYDPEVSYRGASNLEIGEDFGGYPQARTFMFGITLGIL